MKKNTVLKILGTIFVLGIAAVIGLVHVYGPIVGAQFGKPIYIFPPSTERYVKDAVQLIDSGGYYAEGEEWEKQKEKALQQAEKVSSYEEAYPIIEESLKIAGGKHATLLAAEDVKEMHASDEMPTVKRQDDIAIITLPAITDAGTNGQEYAEIPLKFLQENKDVKGVIIDLQGNTGGDMGPMVTAVSPLLPDGKLLTIKGRYSSTPVSLSEGVVSGVGTSIKTDISPFKLDVPVALLLDDHTASSAEALAMTFLDFTHVKTFGEPTAGYASANTTYTLYDGAMMLLTVAYNETPAGKIFYEDPIPVDLETDNPLTEAMNWLK